MKEPYRPVVESKGRVLDSEKDDALAADYTSLFKPIVRTLIEATPEWWTSATLELVAPPDGLGQGVSHLIYNPQHPRDIVVPTEDLMAATRELELASLAQDDPWQRCIFRIDQGEDGWRFVADFQR